LRRDRSRLVRRSRKILAYAYIAYLSAYASICQVIFSNGIFYAY
jgi:hypothetical protein